MTVLTHSRRRGAHQHTSAEVTGNSAQPRGLTARSSVIDVAVAA